MDYIQDCTDFVKNILTFLKAKSKCLRLPSYMLPLVQVYVPNPDCLPLSQLPKS
jgi:hypothetical protein